MSLIARVSYENVTQTFPDQNGSEIDYADIVFTMFDTITHQVTNGNNAVINYEDDGVPKQVVIPGQSVVAQSGIISSVTFNDQRQETDAYYRTITITSIGPGSDIPLSNPGVCDVKINYISIDKPESAVGAADGQVTINASSSYTPLMYSLDLGTTWQSSPTFTGLSGGMVQSLVKDANPLGCTAQATADVPTITNLLTADPSVTLPIGHVSRWNAAFNPVIFTYQRKDFGILGIMIDNEKGYAKVSVNTPLVDYTTGAGTVFAGDMVYVSAGSYQGVYTIDKVSDYNSIVINTPFTGNADGFININRLRPYYQVYTRITYTDKLSGMQSTITATNRPDNAGVIRADLSAFLQSILRTDDNSDYTQTNFRDDNLSASYTLEYAQHYDDGTDAGYTSPYTAIQQPFYVIYAAKQLGDAYGGNLAAYVPFARVTNTGQLARWVTDFAEPACSAGYPFDIGFIYSEEMAGLQLYAELILLDINRNPLPGSPQTVNLLNDDGSWILNQDGGKFIIGNQAQFNMPVPGQLGLNRLLVNGSFLPEAFYISLTLKYNDNENTAHAVTQTQVIRIDDAVDENSVYLRWIGLSGSWNYYRFVYNQEVSLDVQNAVIIKNYVQNWQDQQGIEEVISKSAGQKMKVMAEDLPVNDIRGLQSIKYSPKVQMLISKNPVKWQTIVINTATYSEYETLNGQAPFSITFNMPSINIQAR